MGLARAGTVVLIALAACGRGADDRDPPPPTSTSTSTPTPTPTSTSTPASTPTPTLFRMGRFDDASPRGPRFAWSGSTLRARFRGHGVSVRLKDDNGHNFFRAKVDDKSLVFETKSGEQRYELATGLDDAVHEVTIVKRTEARSGEVQLLGFDFDGGELALGIPHKNRSIEILGDSISTGYGVEGEGDACPDVAKLTDETLTAGALAAEMLDAEHTTIAWSAKTIREVSELWERTLPGHDDSRWDFSAAREPDAVVVNLGTNDFYTGDPGLQTFEKRYRALLDKLRAKYKQAFIVAMLGPMLSNAYPENKRHYSLAQSYLSHAVDSAKQRGETRLVMLDVGPADPHDGWGCRFHPGPVTQRKMADALVRVLRENLSW